jgi:glycerol uptake facilitator-like aquaporin
MAAQYLGAFLAALVLWGEYADLIKLAEATQVEQSEVTFLTRIASSLRQTRPLTPA